MSLVQDTIVWNSRFILGIPLLDNQHKNMVNIANELFAACIESPDIANDHFLKNASGAIEKMYYHFSNEEKLMTVLDYHGFIHHKREHENFIGEAFKLSKEHKSGNKIIPHRFVYFFRDWLLSHMMISDRVLANYIHKMKQNGELKQMLEGKQEGVLLTA